MAPAKMSETERVRLSRSAVVDRALELADGEGIEALTIRRLATELGVTPMALYWHFRSKEELITGLADRIWAEIGTDVDAASPWPAQLRTIFDSLIDVLRVHSSASELLMRGEKLGPSHWDVTEKALEILRGAGFDTWQASSIARSALWTGLTLVMSEPGTHFAGDTEQEQADTQRRKQVELASLPPGKYPRLVEAAIPMTSCDDPDTHYRFGVDLFIAGVMALAAGLAPGGQPAALRNAATSAAGS